MRVEEIIEDIVEPFSAVKETLRGALDSDYRELGVVSRSLVSMRGKMLRPALALLCAKLFAEPTQRTVNVAAMVELVHSATLTHDDVIDEAYTRHNTLTLSVLLRSRSAVLVGDFMFSKGLSLASQVKAYEELDMVITAIERLVEGELKQSRNVRRLSVSREDYYEVARLKTASLISAAAGAGAYSVGASSSDVEKLMEYGAQIGIAFQIMDDILDFLPESKSGKGLYNDVKERKITLPLILAMEQGGRGVLRDLRRGDVGSVVRFVERYGGVEAAQREIEEIVARAVESLESFAHSSARRALVSLAHFAGSRNN